MLRGVFRRTAVLLLDSDFLSQTGDVGFRKAVKDDSTYRRAWAETDHTEAHRHRRKQATIDKSPEQVYEDFRQRRMQRYENLQARADLGIRDTDVTN
jgi:hypothetical protein